MFSRPQRDHEMRGPTNGSCRGHGLRRAPWMRLPKDEQLLARADRVARARLRWLQLMPILLLMLVPFGIFVSTSNKAILMVMILVLLTVYAPLVSLVGVVVARNLGSDDENVRRTYVRLRLRREGKSSDRLA